MAQRKQVWKKLSKIKRDNKGLQEQAFLIMLLSVLLFAVSGIILGVFSKASDTVETAQGKADGVIEKYAGDLTSDSGSGDACKKIKDTYTGGSCIKSSDSCKSGETDEGSNAKCTGEQKLCCK